MMTRTFAGLPGLVLSFFLLVTASVQAGDRWSWELNNDQFKRLDQFQRSRYEKAAKLTKAGEFKSACAEWETFRLEYEDQLDNDLLAYVTFMIGYSQHQGKNRNQAIKSYTEVLDYFADEDWVAATALYHRGVAHFDNGDQLKGLSDMKAMVTHPEYRLHVLAAGSLRQLADNHWRNKEVEEAIRYWKQAYTDFSASNWPEAEAARNNVIGYYLRNRNFDQITGWLGKERPVIIAVIDRAYRGFGWEWDLEYPPAADSQKKKAEDITACWQWVKGLKPLFLEEEGKDLWTYHSNVLQFVCRCLSDKPERDAMIDEVVQYTRDAKLSEADWNNRLSWISDRICESRDYVKARLVLGLLKDRFLAAYKGYEVTGHHEQKWKEADLELQALENAGNADWAVRAKEQRAYIYKDRLGLYPEAIKLYQELNNPPHNLWAIQECYRRWGKTEEAMRTLNEIVGMFPDWAARAVYCKAEYYRTDGDKKAAVALYRQILKHEEWKNSPEAPGAHQRLEEWGFETGGGVIHED